MLSFCDAHDNPSRETKYPSESNIHQETTELTWKLLKMDHNSRFRINAFDLGNKMKLFLKNDR